MNLLGKKSIRRQKRDPTRKEVSQEAEAWSCSHVEEGRAQTSKGGRAEGGVAQHWHPEELLPRGRVSTALSHSLTPPHMLSVIPTYNTILYYITKLQPRLMVPHPVHFVLSLRNVINSKSDLEEIREKFPSAKDRARKRREDSKAGLVDLINAPERAASIVRSAHDKTTKRTPYVTGDADYRRFVTEGARITDGSFVENREDRLREVSSKFVPRTVEYRLVHKLQR